MTAEVAATAVAAVDEELLTAQDWSAYSAEQHEVWSILYRRRMAELAGTASRVYLAGAERIGLAPDRVPDLERINRRLSALTGWSALPVNGFIPAEQFFRALALRRFPTTVTLRPRQRIEYVSEPDIFHDVFGHVPLHAHAAFADFLQEYGAAAALARTAAERRMMGNLFWFTVEFGLIREDGEPRIYGSGLVSSSEDAANALSDRCERRPFSLDEVAARPVDTGALQEVLFVIESFEQLFAAVGEARARLGG